MEETENIKEKEKEQKENNYLSTPSVPLAYFLLKYWKDRNEIFNELYEILYNKKNEINMDLNQNDSEDDFSELKFFEKNPNYFKYFEDPKFQSTIKIENKNEIIEDDNDDIDNNNNESDSDSFIINTRKKIYENYLNNYIKSNYKFKNKNFSLSSDFSQKIFFQINNIKIFEINYLKIIIINKNTKEWVCNSYYGLYLLHKIKKCKKPYPIYPKKDKDIEIKSISNEGDFDEMISKGINEFEDLNYEIDLDKMTEELEPYFNLQLLKCSNSYNQFLNLTENIGKKGKYDFLNKLFQYKFLSNNFIYIFQSKNYLNTENILDNLISINNRSKGRFLYLDMDYINKIKSRNDLKKYLAFWLIRAFFKTDLKNYKSFYESIAKYINFRNIDYIIKSLIEFNRKNYEGEKIFIILNNVNGEKNHVFINNIKNATKDEGTHHNFIIFSNIEDEYNFKKFFEIYKNEGIKLILLPNLIFSESINNESDEINKLFSVYSPEIFTDLIKIFHFTSFMNYKSAKNINDFSELNIIEKYIKFFTLCVKNNLDETKPIIKDIKFKNKNIEEKFLLQYENYFLNAIQTDENLKAVLNLNDGDFFEKLIILDIITGKIKKNNNNINDNFEKLEVGSLFGLEIKELDLNKYKGKNIIFIQKNKTAEIFDVGILFNQNNILIMKLYQISTKKSKEDLEKLDEDIIKLHCININKNLEKLGTIKKFSFGIITSYNCFKEKKDDYKLMKTHCKNNNFELLIYNIIEKKFYIEKEGEENTLLPLENIYSISDINNLVLPNYDSFFQIKPRFITMKYLNRNYIDCFKKYFNENEKCHDIKIIGKIDYDKSLISSSFNDDNLGLLISGYIPGEKYDKEKKEESLFENNTEYRIIKEKGKNIIYEKNPYTIYISENKKFEKSLTNPNAILFKYDEKKYLNKKRNPDELFSKSICIKK